MESNNETASLLKSLLERFDSLESDVKSLKEREARRSASESASEPESSTRREDNSTQIPEGDKEEAEPRRHRRKTQRRRRRTPISASDEESSRSSERSRSPPRRKRSRKGKSPARSSGPSWAERMSASEEEIMDYTKEVQFSDSETEDQSSAKVMEVSGRTKKFLQDKCTRRVPNSERREIREKFPFPKVAATRPAQLDPMMRAETSTAVKAADKQLAKVQALLLDSLAPLTTVLDVHHKGEAMDPKEVIQAVKAGMTLIGNANAHLLHLRREKIVGDINKALLPIVGDEANFKEVAPLLFGTEFAKKSQEMVEQVKAMRSTITKNTSRKPSFFRSGPPNRGGFNRRFGRGGAQSSRYREYRERPYPGGKGQSQQKRTQS